MIAGIKKLVGIKLSKGYGKFTKNTNGNSAAKSDIMLSPNRYFFDFCKKITNKKRDKSKWE